MSITSKTADLLVERVLSWIKQMEHCAERLKKLAEQLESLRGKCNANETFGSNDGSCFNDRGQCGLLLHRRTSCSSFSVAATAFTTVGVGVSVGTASIFKSIPCPVWNMTLLNRAKDAPRMAARAKGQPPNCISQWDFDWTCTTIYWLYFKTIYAWVSILRTGYDTFWISCQKLFGGVTLHAESLCTNTVHSEGVCAGKYYLSHGQETMPPTDFPLKIMEWVLNKVLFFFWFVCLFVFSR